MKASELIRALQQAIDLHGDLTVYYDAGACDVESVDFTPEQENWPATPFFELN